MEVTSVVAGCNVDVRGHVLLVPGAGGLAHLGELCTDAVVTTFGLSRVAVVKSRHLLPVAMASAWRTSTQELVQGGLGLTTGAELYQSASAPRLSVLQLRSMAADGRRTAVAEELWTWATEAGVAEIVMVSACSSHVRTDTDLAAATDLRFVLCQGGDGGQGDMPCAPAGPDGTQLPVLPLGHGFTPGSDGAADIDLTPGRVSAALTLLRGGGLSRPMLRLAGAAESDVAKAGDGNGKPGALCLLGFSSEGVDWQLTERLAKVVCLCAAQKIGVQAPGFQMPPSWQFEVEATAPQLWG